MARRFLILLTMQPAALFYPTIRRLHAGCVNNWALTMFAIEIENLTQDYQVGFWRKRVVRALAGVSLQVACGEVFGFLGPNSAGKTTTFKVLMRLLYPTAGTARILGCELDDLKMRARIGYLPEQPYFYDYLTAREFLVYCGRLC